MDASCRASISVSVTIALLVLSVSGLSAAEDWKEVQAAVLKAMRSSSVSDQETALESLQDHDREEATELLLKAVGAVKTPSMVRACARDVLSTFRSQESRDAVYDAVRWKPTSSYVLLEIFAAMGDERAPKVGKSVLARLGSDKNKIQVGAAAIRCMAAAGGKDAGEIESILKYADEGHPISWRFAAVDSVLRIRTAPAVERLIELLDDPGMNTHVRRVLVQLAGEDSGPMKVEWEAWWETQGKHPPAADPIGEAEAKQLIATRVKTAAEAKAEADRIAFYGIPVEGKNILFVLDASTSMRGYPLERLKSECRALVDRLPESHKLALLFFPGNESFPKEMELATPELKKRAHAFIEKRKVIRGTPVGKAMQTAYKRFGGESVVDAIYLISDGAPTNPITKVLMLIDDLNAGLYIPIHTIYIGQVEPAKPGEPAPEEMVPPKGPIRTGWEFLKEVARRHDGTFNIVIP